MPQRVLIAEDEHLQATALATHLAALGIGVVGPASSGDACLQLARSDKPDLALLDIRMPGIDGLTAAAVLQDELDVPVVLVSAYSDEAYVAGGTGVGVHGYLLKPVSQDQLRVAIAVAWAAHAQRQRLHEESAELRAALAERKLIERAKGILMDRHAMKEADAMRHLQKEARNTRRRLADVAHEIIDQDAKRRGPSTEGPASS